MNLIFRLMRKKTQNDSSTKKKNQNMFTLKPKPRERRLGESAFKMNVDRAALNKCRGFEKLLL